MWRSALVVLACVLPSNTLLAQAVNTDAATLQDFQNRIAAYVKLHNKAMSALRNLKPTASPERIARHEKELAHKIHEAREHVLQGNIFTTEIAGAFRRLVGNAMDGGGSNTVHQSLRRSEPVVIQLKVNHHYPEGVPLQTTPPSLLLNLPKLPPELEYRVVGRAMVLRDVAANLIVDYLPNAIP